MDTTQTTRLIDRYPALAALGRAALDAQAHAQWTEAPAGAVLFELGRERMVGLGRRRTAVDGGDRQRPLYSVLGFSTCPLSKA